LLNPKIAIAEGCAGYWVKHHQQMQGNYGRSQSRIVNQQHLEIFSNILGKLAANGQLLPKYKKAACTVLWPLAHWIAKDDIEKADEVVNWIYELDPDFKIPNKGILGFLYRNAGLKTTHKIMKARQLFKKHQ
jgi:hypothetical protein